MRWGLFRGWAASWLVSPLRPLHTNPKEMRKTYAYGELGFLFSKIIERSRRNSVHDVALDPYS